MLVETHVQLTPSDHIPGTLTWERVLYEPGTYSKLAVLSGTHFSAALQGTGILNLYVDSSKKYILLPIIT